MNLYVESSAVLAWLLGETTSSEVLDALETATDVVTSELTLLEVRRGLVRANVEARISEAQAAQRRAELVDAATRWHILRVDEGILERAGRPFPMEPVRTIDALHLSSLLEAQGSLADLAVLSLDNRIRRNARALGFSRLPEGDDDVTG